MKKEDEKAQTEKASFFQANRKREKQRILTKESIIKLVLSQTRSFEEEEEERGLHSRRGIKKFFSHTRGWVFCAREKERERFCFRGRKKLPHF